MGYRDYSTAKGHIVDATGHGDFTSIQTAINAALSGHTIFVRPGTYTENLILKAGVNITAFDSDMINQVIILGKTTLNVAGSVSISGIQFKTNGDYCIEVSGAVASSLFAVNCFINANDHTAINCASSSPTSSLILTSCLGNVNAGGSSVFDHSSAGLLRFINTFMNNTANSVTACTASAGSVALDSSGIENGITTSGTCSFTMLFSFIQTGFINVPSVIQGSSGGSFAAFSSFGSGTASAVDISTAFIMAQMTINSTNANAITGTGALTAGILTYLNNSVINGTVTVTKLTTFGGNII